MEPKTAEHARLDAVRAQTVDDLEEIRTKVLRCFEAGALATGATLEIGGQRHPYAQLRHDPDLAAATNHQPEFAAHCVTPAADQALVDGALAMAWTAIDLAQTATIRHRLLGVTSA